MKNYKRFFTSLFFIYLAIFSCSKNKNNPPVTPPPPDTSLIAYFAFNGNAIDSSIYRHDGMVSNAVLTTDRFGASNKAYDFDGKNSYIRLPGTPQFDQNGSISILAWVNPQLICGPGVGCYIVWRGDGQSAHDPYALYFNNNSVGIRKDIGNGTITNQALAPVDNSFQNKWTHIAGTYDAVTHNGKVYINGIIAKEEVFTTSAVSYTTAGFLTNIGLATIGPSNDPIGAFKGSIDEVRIYKRVLTPEEILKLSR